jgi:hypothetical protein
MREKAASPTSGALRSSAPPYRVVLKRGLSGRCGRSFHLDVGMKDGLPCALLHFPNGAGVVGAGGVLPTIGALDGDLVGTDHRVRSLATAL